LSWHDGPVSYHDRVKLLKKLTVGNSSSWHYVPVSYHDAAPDFEKMAVTHRTTMDLIVARWPADFL
ncbi:hypothetical protein A2U01_0117762, partial [Trifolium medium]|nr:hypothetical protein [Trifolium medium]